jgi:ribonuclease Y
MVIIIAQIVSVLGIIIASIMFFYARKRMEEANGTMHKIQEKWKTVKRETENERREAQLKVKDEIYRKRMEFEAEVKKERLELERLQSKIADKYEALEKKEEQLDDQRGEVQQTERKLSRMSEVMHANEEKLKSLYTELINKLENIAGISKDQAKKELFDTLQAEVKLANEKWIQKVEEESRQIAKDRSNQIVVSAMQRYTIDQVSPNSSSVVHLPAEEANTMKARIIGKEGRNIKSLEMATGMEFVISTDTPEIITISGFNPIRREVARRSLEKLILDGRINPTRIEETVQLCEREIDEIVQEYGKKAILECNVQGIHSDIVTLLGKLHFRTSFSQNVLEHSIEVGMFARMIAEELGLDGKLAMRAGLLHDIGKAVTAEVEGPHAIIGGDIAKRCGEDPLVVNAISAHHEEVVFMSIYAPLVVIADTISASRPGARRETLTAYVKRLEKLEEIANSFTGVKKAYALQAGREIRIIVEEDFLDDDKALILARDVAKKIEEEMNFPGQIKVNVIREKRAIEYAR